MEEEEALAVEEEVEAHDKPLRFGNRWVYGIKEGSKFLVSFPFLHVDVSSERTKKGKEGFARERWASLASP